MITRIRKMAGAMLLDGAFRGLARLGRLHPKLRPHAHRLEIISDVPYVDDGNPDHLLDVWRPREADGKLPVVLYVHGGAFRILSKDTHYVMAIAFARRGHVVFNINYRLAPRHRFPAALEDAAAAYEWVVQNAARYGGDPTRIIVAGESAGANLVTGLTICASYRRPEPYARRVFDTGITPIACLPACGILQVSDTGRFTRRRSLPRFIADRLEETELAYLGRERRDAPLADPLVVLEKGDKPDRPLPPFFTFAGTKDPLLDDTRRLEAALGKLGVPCRAKYYPGEVHAFHALVWRPNAIHTWRETFAFLDELP
jgi:acetyl esterase